jgi:hypothetical protein
MDRHRTRNKWWRWCDSGRCAAHLGGTGREALEPHAERIRSWVQHDEPQLTRVQELLAQDGVRCSYMTLLRFVRRSGWGSKPRSTVRVAKSQPGDVGEIDYGRMDAGVLLNPLTGKRQVIWALVVVLPSSRHCFVWLTMRQRRSSFAFTSNRGVDEWLGLFDDDDDPILGNSALDRLPNAAHQVVIESSSYCAKLAPKRREVVAV